jgi:secernin
MCDTLVALGNSRKDGTVIFGKNSDRPNDEAQLISFAPRMRHSKGEELKCTYISIPQVPETYAVLMSQPFWMFGCEMGANEYGVVIGNEAVHTLEPLRSTGLLGMDLLRLGLERGKTAVEALKVITELLERFGQGGRCARGDPSWRYHNSFIITDSREAYVLETADKWWIVERVKDVRSISNGVTIRGKGDLRRIGIIDHAIKKGYCRDDNEFDFASTFTGYFISNMPSPYSREGKARLLLKENEGKITLKAMMEFLRDHEAGICMHGGFESTGSQVSHLRKNNKSIHWFTGSTLPCLSVYKPYAFPIKEQAHENPGPYPKIDPMWYWWRHTTNKPKLKRNWLREIENSVISKINDTIQVEDRMSEKEFIDKIKIINNEAWNQSETFLS